MEEKFSQLYIDGSWTPAISGQTVEVICPADGQTIATIALGAAADIDLAVKAAMDAFTAWSSCPGRERGILINRLADLLERDLEEVARLEALDIGRPYAEPLNVDIPSAIATLRTFAGWADKIDGRTIPGPDHFGRPVHSYTTRVPVGVVGAILPWNAPTMIACWKIAPALAAGCTLVIKPALEAPLAVMYLARLAEEAGFPAGVINVVPGHGSDVGAALVRHPGVAKLTFTGSPAVGKDIAQQAAALMRPVTLELGGKAPQLIFEDADLDAAIQALAAGIFTNQGEICAAGSRILVHRSIEKKLVSELSKIADARVIGHPLDPNANMGSLINRKHFETVTGYIAEGLREGARIATNTDPVDGSGFFVRPTVFSGVTNDMRIAREEIFGPVACVIPFDGEEEAIRIANDSDYSLSANVWTQNLSRGHRVAAAIKAGSVWVNGGGTPDPRTVWGGGGLSGIGRELGVSAIHSHTVEKAINVLL